MAYLYVLDYSNSTICEIELDEEENNDDVNIDEIFRKRGMKTDNCSWMFSDEKLDITPIFRED